MHWIDLFDDRRNDAWLGLLVSASDAHHTPRPALRMEAGGPRLMCLVADRTPVVWARVASDHYGYWYLRAPNGLPGAQPLSPIRVDEARRHGPSGAEDWYKSWARYFAKELARSALNPIGGEQMLLGRAEVQLGEGGWPYPRGGAQVPAVNRLASVLDVPSHGFCAWDFGDDLAPLPLRPLAEVSSGRVKALRKLVRDDMLPPVLTWWISGLQRHVILDGHDRLVASLLEDRAPKCIVLMGAAGRSVQRDPKYVAAIENEVQRQLERREAPCETPKQRSRQGVSVEQANRLLIDAFDDRPFLSSSTRAWPLEGGAARWFGDVRRALVDVHDADEDMVL